MPYDISPPLDERMPAINEYLETGFQDDTVFTWIRQEAEKRGIPGIHIGPIQGRYLHLTARMIAAKRILEVGTLAGYSGLWLARALPEDGLLTTIESNPAHVEMARETFRRGGVADRVRLIEGNAKEVLRGLREEAKAEPFDMAFLDADKDRNIDYLEWCIQGRRVRRNGVIVVDNVLRDGTVMDPPPGADGETDTARVMADFNAHLFAQYPYSAMVLPFFRKRLDGMAVILVP